MDVYQKSLKLHEENKGKIEVISKVIVTNKEELSLAYDLKYYEIMKERIQDVFNAYYSSDLEDLEELKEKYGL